MNIARLKKLCLIVYDCTENTDIVIAVKLDTIKHVIIRIGLLCNKTEKHIFY